MGLLPQLTTSTSFYLILQMLLFQIPPVLPKVRNPGSSLLPEMLLAKSSILAQVPAKLPRNVLLLLPDVDTCPPKITEPLNPFCTICNCIPATIVSVTFIFFIFITFLIPLPSLSFSQMTAQTAHHLPQYVSSALLYDFYENFFSPSYSNVAP